MSVLVAQNACKVFIKLNGIASAGARCIDKGEIPGNSDHLLKVRVGVLGSPRFLISDCQSCSDWSCKLPANAAKMGGSLLPNLLLSAQLSTRKQLSHCKLCS